MYDFKIEAADKATLYSDLAWALEGLVAGEPDAIANMANATGLIFEALPDVNWVGFYRNIGGELVLGPFQGRPACIRIPFDQGVCGAAAASATGRGCPRLPRPYRLRQRLEQRDRRAPDPGRRAARRARHRQPQPRAVRR